jgi:sulfite exporter TauE/SafE
MELWTAVVIGLVGSLHCLGMCGPLALAVPAAGNSRRAFLNSRLLYTLGRLSSYALLGLVFGSLGQTLVLAGLQRWASLIAGLCLLLGLVFSAQNPLRLTTTRGVGYLKCHFSTLLKRRTMSALLLLGGLNGLLPCGLVYVAAVSAAARLSVVGSMLYMFAFGLGTVPAMLGLALFGRNVQAIMRLRLQRLIPVCVLLLAALLILRGMSLGIPFVSPQMGHGTGNSCH